MPHYAVRRIAGSPEELSCLIQLEGESAAMYFNIVHGGKTRRRFTTEKIGRPNEDYLLIAREFDRAGFVHERVIALFDLT